MTTRTHGETKDCRGCRYWSEMVAMVQGGEVVALCLCSVSPLSSKYTSARQTCDEWKSGHHGAVDDPPNYGEETRALYAAEDDGEIDF